MIFISEKDLIVINCLQEQILGVFIGIAWLKRVVEWVKANLIENEYGHTTKKSHNVNWEHCRCSMWMIYFECKIQRVLRRWVPWNSRGHNYVSVRYLVCSWWLLAGLEFLKGQVVETIDCSEEFGAEKILGMRDNK